MIGLGRIGRAVARRAAGFGMPVLYTARHRLPADEEAALGVAWRELDELLAEADFVTIHTGLSAATRHLIGARELARMKPTAVLVNTARGPIVDEAALAAALAAGELGAAGLDVFEHEPEVHPGLLDLDNATIVPHLGTSTLETRVAMGMTAAANLLAALEGRRPPNLLNPGSARLGTKVPLLADPVGLGQPGGHLLVGLVQVLQPELVQVVAGREGLDPPEPGVLQPPGQDHVPVHPAAPQGEGGEAHPHLEGDPGLLGQDGDRAVALGQLDQAPEDGHHLGVLAGQVPVQVEGAAGVRLVAVGERPPAARAGPHRCRVHSR